MKKNCSIVIALSISLFIYVFYRSEKTVVNALIVRLVSFDTYAMMKSVIVAAIPLSDQIIFSLPGGLWIFCATLLAQDFYIAFGKHQVQVVLVPILFAIGLEFCQLIHFTNGRFDTWDIAFYLMFWLLATYSFQSRGYRQNIWSPFTLHGFICLACFLAVYLAHVNR